MELINTWRGDTDIEKIRYIVKDILVLKRNFHRCKFTWIGRDGKNLAHTVAQKTRPAASLPIGCSVYLLTLKRSWRKRNRRKFREEIKTTNWDEEMNKLIIPKGGTM